MRSPSIFSDWSVRPSFFRTTPAKKPRTECCCQLVAFMIAAIVAPLGWLSSAITVARLEFERGVAVRAVVVSWILLAGLAGRASFDFLDGLVVWHAGILSSVVDGILGRLTTEAPQWRIAGRAGSRAVKTRASSTVTLWSRPKSSPFCDNLVAMIEPQRSWSDQGQALFAGYCATRSLKGFNLPGRGTPFLRPR
jgi:hypothetical protein